MSIRAELTVAAVVERAGRFLLVEERVGNRMVFNQPAGHVERGESFLNAVVRETLEETAWEFHPEALIGVYLWEQPERRRSFLRATFCGRVSGHDPARPLDRGIERALWLTRAQIIEHSARLRSPMVLRGIDDYLEGTRHPMDILKHVLEDARRLSAQELRSREHPALSPLS